MRPIAPSVPAAAIAINIVGVDNFTLPARMLLWAIRTWSAHHCDLAAIRPSLDRAFADWGMNHALPAFDRMMSAVFSGLRRWPDVRCVRCPRLGTDEACLLDALAHLQQGKHGAARLALQDWVVRSAAFTACVHGAEFVDQATAAGVRFGGPSTLKCGGSQHVDMGNAVF